MEKSFSMNGGDGPTSYSKNSQLQGHGSDRAKEILTNSIIQNLTIKDDIKVFSIADFGCSTGPNTFSYVQTIVDAVKLKFNTQHTLENQLPDLQVFFNDHVTNDFNMLFKALSCDARNYFAAGVPGSFYEQLFPKASINFMISYFALHWLRGAPKEVTKQDSLLLNKGCITYANSSNEIAEAFRCEFFSGMKDFLAARSAEISKDGLLVIMIPCRPEGSHPKESVMIHELDYIGCALKDMANEGLVNEELIDTFNLPLFLPSPNEVAEEVSRNVNFSIEVIKELYNPKLLNTPDDASFCSTHFRAVTEGLLSAHFGSDIIDELFDRYTHNLEELSKTPNFTDSAEEFANLFLVVKRK